MHPTQADFNRLAIPQLSSWSKVSDRLLKVAKLAAVLGLAALAYLVTGWAGFFAALIGGALYYKLSHRSAQQQAPAQPAPEPPIQAPGLLCYKFTSTLLDPIQPIDLQNISPNKLFAYRKLMGGRDVPIEKPIDVRKVVGKAPPDEPFLQKAGPVVQLIENTPFLYPEGNDHWTANFGDARLFFGCKKALAAQDEIQALEHPAILHLSTFFERISPLSQDGSAVLISGIKRYGNLDTSQIIPRLQKTIYGNSFAQATPEELDAVLEKFPEPRDSNLFVFVAPNIPANLEGQPYGVDRLTAAFSNAYAAFSSIVVKNPNAIIHTGNWGCGAFGGDPKTMALIQLAAARLAGVKELRYYAMNQGEAFRRAQELDAHIAGRYDLTPNQFPAHLESHSLEYNLLYGRGNGT